MTPPASTPATKTRFQLSLFQLYWKKGILPGKQAAHICRSVEEIPNDLLPSINNNGTTNPINGPATYQGQGCLIKCKRSMRIDFCKGNDSNKKAVRQRSHSFIIFFDEFKLTHRFRDKLPQYLLQLSGLYDT